MSGSCPVVRAPSGKPFRFTRVDGFCDDGQRADQSASASSGIQFESVGWKSATPVTSDPSHGASQRMMLAPTRETPTMPDTPPEVQPIENTTKSHAEAPSKIVLYRSVRPGADCGDISNQAGSCNCNNRP